MSKNFTTSNKPSIQPDVSAKPKSKFSPHDISIAIGIVLIILVILILMGVGLSDYREENLTRATTEAEATKAQYDEKIAELLLRAEELTKREEEVNLKDIRISIREKAVKQGEEEMSRRSELLESDRADLTEEEEAFYASQSRIKELCRQLLDELTLNEEDE